MDTSSPRDELLCFNRAQLLDVLESLRGAQTMEALRQAIIDLKLRLFEQGDARLCRPQVNPPDAYSAAPNEADILFSRDILINQLDQIVASRKLERGQYYLERLIKSITQIRTSSINDINLNRWKEYPDIITDSLWMIERRDNSGVHSSDYHGNFIPQIPNQMIRRYTRAGEWVLDCFAGLGTTLIEGQRLGRNTLGVELQPGVAEQARRLVAAEPNQAKVVSHVVTADSATLDYSALLAKYGQSSVQLAILHPPYFDIIKFSDDPRDLSNADCVESFLDRLNDVVKHVSLVLDPGRFLVLVIGDKYAGGEWIPLGFLAMDQVKRNKFALKSIVVKNFEETTGKRTQRELWRYRALAGGFYIFKHEYIFILEKRRR